MTGSPPTTGNPSLDRPNPVPTQPATRPPVPRSLDGSAPPLTCENTAWDGWTGRWRTRPPVPQTGATTPHLTAPPNPAPGNARHATISPTHRSATDASPVPSDTTESATGTNGDDTTDPSDVAELSDSDQVPRPRQGTSTRRSQSGSQRPKHHGKGNRASGPVETTTGDLVGGTVPTPEQWAQEQLKHAPHRSRAWARGVAALYGLELLEQ